MPMPKGNQLKTAARIPKSKRKQCMSVMTVNRVKRKRSSAAYPVSRIGYGCRVHWLGDISSLGGLEEAARRLSLGLLDDGSDITLEMVRSSLPVEQKDEQSRTKILAWSYRSCRSLSLVFWVSFGN